MNLCILSCFINVLCVSSRFHHGLVRFFPFSLSLLPSTEIYPPSMEWTTSASSHLIVLNIAHFAEAFVWFYVCIYFATGFISTRVYILSEWNTTWHIKPLYTDRIHRIGFYCFKKLILLLLTLCVWCSCCCCCFYYLSCLLVCPLGTGFSCKAIDMPAVELVKSHGVNDHTDDAKKKRSKEKWNDNE